MDGAQQTPETSARSGFLTIGSATFASYCAFLLAAASLALGVIYVLLPARIGDVEAALFEAGSQPSWYQWFFADWALAGLLGLAVVGPATRLLAARPNGWTEWTSKLAYLGFAVTVVQGVHQFVNVPGLGQLYQGCHTCTGSLAEQQLLAKWLYVTQSLDPLNWLTIGAIGLWLLALNVVGFGAAGIHKGVLFTGITAGVVYLVFAIAGSFDLPLDVLAVLLTLVGAAWYAWMGVLLRRAT